MLLIYDVWVVKMNGFWVDNLIFWLVFCNFALVVYIFVGVGW